MKRLALMGLLLIAPQAAAQESADYKLNEHVLNSGGNPKGGVVLSSASFKVTLDSIGEGVARRGMSSASFKLDAGFVPRYLPPGEIEGLAFTDGVTLAWDPERTAGWYNLYRDLMSNLAALGYGDCEQYGLTTNGTIDNDTVPAGDGYFYLVTVKNRLYEEGTKGNDSDDRERPNPNPCP